MDPSYDTGAGPDRRAALGLLAAAAALYLLFPAAVLECDAVIYACAGLSADPLQSTDAGHLAWGFVELAAARVGRTLDPPLNPVYLLRWLAVAATLAGIWFFGRLVRESGATAAAAFLVTGSLAFSYSVWHFGIQAESHLIATFFLVLFARSTWFALRDGDLSATARASVFLSLSTLFHQTGILLVPAFLVPAWFAGATTRERLRIAAVFLGVYFLLVIVPYLGVGWFVRGLRDYGEFRDWILGLSLWGMWGEWEPTSGPSALVGAGRSLVGSHYLLGIGWIERLAFRLVPNASWEDEVALAVTVPPTVRIVLLGLQVVWFAALAAGCVKVAARLRAAWSDEGRFAAFLGLWLAVYVPFIVWWAPIRAEFWIAVFVPALLLAGRTLLRRRPAGARDWILPVGFVAALAVLNGAGSVAPQARHDVEPELGRLLALDAVARPGDYVLSETDLRGRATRYVYSLNKIDLLDPQPWRTTLLSPAWNGPPRPGSPADRNRLPLPDVQDPTGRALGAVAAALQAAEQEGATVYLALRPLTGDPGRRERYRTLVGQIAERFVLSDPVAVRDGGEWRRVLRPVR